MILSRNPTTISWLFPCPKRHETLSLATDLTASMRYMRDRTAATISRVFIRCFFDGLSSGGIETFFNEDDDDFNKNDAEDLDVLRTWTCCSR